MKYLLGIVISIACIASSINQLLKMEATWSAKFICLVLIAIFFTLLALLFIVQKVKQKKI